jgi:GNAT superfamily N-acetyltransferase
MSERSQWPDGVEARPIGESDVDAWADLRAAAEKVDQEGENYDADDLREELAHPALDAATDTIGLWADGAMVAFSTVRWRANVVDVHRVMSDGTVHPEWRGRGLGTALLGWLIPRAKALHAQKHPEVRGVLTIGVISTNAAAHDLLLTNGFAESRYYFTMHRALDLPIPDLPTPDGLRSVPFDPAHDDAVRLLHNEAFRDHWGSSPTDEQTWQVWVTGSRAFRSDLSRVVFDGADPVSYTLGYEYLADTEATGVREVYIGQVGTLRSHRGRGLARLTLAQVMSAAHEQGYQRASLGVDTANPTGALGLYESLDFFAANKSIAYELPLS